MWGVTCNQSAICSDAPRATMNVGLTSPPEERRGVIVRLSHWLVNEADAVDDHAVPHPSPNLVSALIKNNLKEQTKRDARFA